LRTDPYVALFLPVPVHVAEEKILRAVGRLLPAFVRGRDILALGERERLRARRGRKEGKDREEGDERKGNASHHCCGPPAVLAGCAGGITRHSGHPMTTSFFVRCSRSR